MCTVSLFPVHTAGFILTSNRDESPNRPAVIPRFSSLENTKLLFPEDPRSGGTWVGVSEKKRLVCLLNGGFALHERKAMYRKSRGLVAKDLMLMEDVVEDVENYNFKDIEPFTVVIVDWNTHLQFFELVWDGAKKHFEKLPLKPKIWSSSTLYTEAMKKERQCWFHDFLIGNDRRAGQILTFHKSAGGKNRDYGVIMDRGFVKTTSITQVEKYNDVVKMRYETLENKMVSEEVFDFQKSALHG
ncbi:NRDE family protein [Pseudotamlana carrageenivorans]|uniref:NRDE family protein n=1 Tax=Pseudotamlana carrageenivorans TaxID=2069432 RepID=A0A2I7SJC7_9FLAO|nr:NRDE family protein [Tamlana carrageenivorans]AUS06012.1 hypothetical protein C1A40_11355 [Tamlana carrageenivorans]